MNTTRRFPIAACALALGVVFAAAPQAQAADWGWTKGGEQVQGNGNVQRQAREVGHFTGIALSLPGKVEVRSGAREGVTVETDANLLPLIETVVENGTLKIRRKDKVNLRTRNLTFVVQAREVERLSVAGSGDIDADAVRGERIQLEIGGSGDIRVRKAEGASIGVNVSGSGDLQVDGGSARSLSVSLAGSGDVDLAHVRSDDAKVNIAGSGDAKVWARNDLSVSVAGSGDVDYYGDPRVRKSVAGSGGVQHAGSAP
jgi:hypothetical protein